MRTRWMLGCGIGLLPFAAAAHSPVKGVLPFYGGMLHPFIVPAHLMAILACGLFIGQSARAVPGRAVASLGVLALALAAGLCLSGRAGDPDTDPLLLAATAAIGLLVAWARPLPAAAVMVAAGIVGVVMGLGSGPEGLAGSKRWITLAGTWLGVIVGTVWMLILSEQVRRPWQQVAVRVVASWITASAVLVLALALFGQRKPANAAVSSETDRGCRGSGCETAPGRRGPSSPRPVPPHPRS